MEYTVVLNESDEFGFATEALAHEFARESEEDGDTVAIFDPTGVQVYSTEAGML